jgi:hypothetical protein
VKKVVLLIVSEHYGPHNYSKRHRIDNNDKKMVSRGYRKRNIQIHRQQS